MRFNRSLLVFLGVLALVGGSAFWFTGSQLARAFPLGGMGVWSAWTWATLLWAFPLFRATVYRHDPGRLQGFAFFLLGMGATTLVLLLLLRLLGLGLGLAGYAWPAWAPWAMLGAGTVFCLWGWQTAYGPAVVKTVRLPTPGLHPGLEGLRIVQISDLHVSHLMAEGQVARMVDQIAELRPDLIAITGDLADGPLAGLKDAVAPLARLKAPLGVHYVTGNHEYFWDVDHWLEELSGLGFEMLLNGHRLVEHRGARIKVLGVNDPAALRVGRSDGPDLTKAMEGAPAADYTLFLAHQPQCFVLAERADADLFLAGHTHGGQFAPFPPIVSLFHRYFRRLYRHSPRLQIYVHSGSGFWGPPNRLGVPPEIALLVLEAGPAAP